MVTSRASAVVSSVVMRAERVSRGGGGTASHPRHQYFSELSWLVLLVLSMMTTAVVVVVPGRRSASGAGAGRGSQRKTCFSTEKIPALKKNTKTSRSSQLVIEQQPLRVHTSYIFVTAICSPLVTLPSRAWVPCALPSSHSVPRHGHGPTPRVLNTPLARPPRQPSAASDASASRTPSSCRHPLRSSGNLLTLWAPRE